MVDVASDSCETVVSWPAIIATDDCDMDVDIAQMSGPANGSSLLPGNYSLSFVATDDEVKNR
ncbi:MAG: hypothetical protein R2784_10600 [Saprospiraceae bacterium]